MKIKTTYSSIQNRYSEAIKAIIARLRAGKSRYKNAKEDTLFWYFDIGAEVRGQTFREVMAEAKAKTKWEPPPPLSFEEYWNELKPRLKVGLIGATWHWQSYKVLDTIPDEVKDMYKAIWEKNEIEKKRIAALTPQQRTEETITLLRKLSEN